MYVAVGLWLISYILHFSFSHTTRVRDRQLIEHCERKDIDSHL